MDFWSTVTDTLASEFSDLPDPEQATRVVTRLLLAAMLGSLIGMEREYAGKSAGLRTHMLVALGAAFFVLLPQQAGIELPDLSRILQGLIAGIGFLCAGAILKAENHVHGLTTSAGLWMTAAVGMGAGLGLGATAALITALTLVLLILEEPLKHWIDRHRRRKIEP